MSPPSAFGPYRVLHQIGSGVLGPVFRAYDSQTDRLVAVKTFKMDLVPESAARLADALRAMAGREPAHPAVIGAAGAGCEGATPFVALDYASGEPLDALLRQTGAWPLARALPVLQMLAAAIDAVWAQSIGHGALHPRDIFIDGSSPPDVRVSGIGISQAIESIGARPPVRRPYSAPECADGRSWDRRADVYSLGVIAVEMLSGQRPVLTDTESDGLAPDLPPEARAAVRPVLAVAMAERPDDRYDSATALVDALAEASRSAAGAAGQSSADSDAAPVAEPVPPAEPPMAAARARRTKPLVLDLPLLDRAAAADHDDPTLDELPAFLSAAPVGRVAPEPVAPLTPEPAAPAHAPAPLVADAPSHATEPRFRDIDSDPGLPARLAPRLDFGRSATRAEDGMPGAPGDEPPAPGFPWAATAAVFAAGLVVGGVVMYQLGWRGGSEAARAAAAAATVTAAPSASSGLSEPTPAGRPSQGAGIAEPAATPTPAARTAASGPARTPAASPATGRLVIESVPAGALVTIDGRRAGETPLTVSVPLGRHDVQIARPGYVPRVQRVELTRRGPSRTLRVQLKRGAGGGAAEAGGAAGAPAPGVDQGGRVGR